MNGTFFQDICIGVIMWCVVLTLLTSKKRVNRILGRCCVVVILSVLIVIITLPLFFGWWK